METIKKRRRIKRSYEKVLLKVASTDPRQAKANKVEENE